MNKLIVCLVLAICLIGVILPTQVFAGDRPDRVIVKPVPVLANVVSYLPPRSTGYQPPLFYYNPKCTIPVQVLDFGTVRTGQNSVITVYTKNKIALEYLVSNDPCFDWSTGEVTKYKSIPVYFRFLAYEPGNHKFFLTAK